MEELLEIAKEIEFNAKAEAQAVLDYTELLKKVLASGIDEEQVNLIADTISEIISDELNHQMKLGQLYVKLTGIEPNQN